MNLSKGDKARVRVGGKNRAAQVDSADHRGIVVRLWGTRAGGAPKLNKSVKFIPWKDVIEPRTANPAPGCETVDVGAYSRKPSGGRSTGRCATKRSANDRAGALLSARQAGVLGGGSWGADDQRAAMLDAERQLMGDGVSQRSARAAVTRAARSVQIPESVIKGRHKPAKRKASKPKAAKKTASPKAPRKAPAAWPIEWWEGRKGSQKPPYQIEEVGNDGRRHSPRVVARRVKSLAEARRLIKAQADKGLDREYQVWGRGKGTSMLPRLSAAVGPLSIAAAQSRGAEARAQSGRSGGDQVPLFKNPAVMLPTDLDNLDRLVIGWRGTRLTGAEAVRQSLDGARALARTGTVDGSRVVIGTVRYRLRASGRHTAEQVTGRPQEHNPGDYMVIGLDSSGQISAVEHRPGLSSADALALARGSMPAGVRYVVRVVERLKIG